MDKTKYGKIALGIFGVHTVLSIVALVCSMSDSHRIFQIGFNLGGWMLIVYPIVGGITYIVVSLIGMIKNRKFLLYLVCPVISIILWLILAGALAAYV